MAATLRKAVLQDAPLISKIATESFFETYAWYNTPENMRQYTQTHFNEEITLKEIAQEKTVFFLAFENDEPAGYAKLRVVEMPEELKGKKHIEVERIYVLAKFQKKKLGYALIDACIEYAKQNKYQVIWLGVWEQNPRAIAFYEKVGFVRFGVHVFMLGADEQKDHLYKLDLLS